MFFHGFTLSVWMCKTSVRADNHTVYFDTLMNIASTCGEIQYLRSHAMQSYDWALARGGVWRMVIFIAFPSSDLLWKEQHVETCSDSAISLL